MAYTQRVVVLFLVVAIATPIRMGAQLWMNP